MKSFDRDFQSDPESRIWDLSTTKSTAISFTIVAMLIATVMFASGIKAFENDLE